MRKEKEMDLLMQKALASNETPDAGLNEEIIRQWDSRNSRNPADDPDFRNEVKEMRKRKMASIAAAAAFFVLAVSTTVVGAVKYLTGDEIVTELGSDVTAKAFRGEEALELDETTEAGDYRFNLYGVTTAEGLMHSGLEEELGKEGGTYVVLSIERLDGTPMPDTSSEEYGNLHFFISPLIQGLEPWQYNMASMGGASSTVVKNGVLYRIIECDDIAAFANRHIYLCISDTDFYENDAYNYNETDGTITRNEAYEGINLLMELPIDKKRADEKKASAYLQELEKSWHEEEEEPEIGENGIVSTDCKPLDDILLKEHKENGDIVTLDDIPLEELLSYTLLKEDSVQEVKPDEDGVVKFTYKDRDGFPCDMVGFLGEEFLQGKTDVVMLGSGYTENEAEFWVSRRDAEGKIMCMVYEIGQ